MCQASNSLNLLPTMAISCFNLTWWRRSLSRLCTHTGGNIFTIPVLESHKNLTLESWVAWWSCLFCMSCVETRWTFTSSCRCNPIHWLANNAVQLMLLGPGSARALWMIRRQLSLKKLSTNSTGRFLWCDWLTQRKDLWLLQCMS